MSDLQIRIADWHKDNTDLRRIRESVFIQEQGVTPEQEWDSDDATATHFLAYEGDFAIGTARLLADGCIGRVSVLKDWRGMHIGEQLLMAAVKEAERKGLTQQMLTAQVHAAGFYERLGFTVVSDEFLEAGIPHIEMLRNSQ
ncbi:MAG: GNAT family N-acetyltransferase [Pseudomonas sp.]|jgi:predicted GNAT family N-acyltransferase|nr:GNAT family N-acetyltransferase [Pseudomonas sp.]MDD2222640.1 GNAT family N-acetyltransferase [Pseudomonas sp.]MDY0413716.1 GNAT family N-acetyltransferase [Pseudomonas sp.]NLO53373.1 GNAT family N-acetyltransferase [Gammaproteobacteria bacterium]